MNIYRIHTLNVKIDKLHDRIDELNEGLSVCTDPILRDNLNTSIALLIEEQGKLCKEIGELMRAKPYMTQLASCPKCGGMFKDDTHETAKFYEVTEPFKHVIVVNGCKACPNCNDNSILIYL
jgi:ribosomal protein S27AE